MRQDLVVQKLDRARQFLAEANTIEKAKQAMAMGDAARIYGIRMGAGKDAMNEVAVYQLLAERNLGVVLKQSPKANGGDAQRTRFQKGRESPPTLKELGIDWKVSSRAQVLAEVPEITFQKLIVPPENGELNQRRVVGDLMRARKQKNEKAKLKQARENPPSVAGPYGLILADPPWRYEHCEADNREIENQYPTATLENIYTHITEVELQDNCILFLWATAPKLAEALSVMSAWAFSYRSCAVWDKQKIGMGYWWRIQHELLLVGVRGKPSCTPETERVSSLFSEPRGKHSVKPDCVYKWIESAFPGISKLEMYCRKPRPNWGAWGNEC